MKTEDEIRDEINKLESHKSDYISYGAYEELKWILEERSFPVSNIYVVKDKYENPSRNPRPKNIG